ncbi:DUF3649 domain-containing protein [Cupriavidus pauculus]|uniref:DUF3649 domain-containing protein n=1 Tax=Cupriavidus pauculus TaxID=82633 RepID=UPI0012450678|nr:DUF3649 domain-containing protein [Cupriavidus pauculus]KAB0602750.1 DUF3649 domain-containing protein [Cupriavidus pauculus]UAL02806.1 DUF3649 domain-containing protein [Cupriavidus pauculus]
MKHGIPASYRIAVASRAVAAILGGYGVAALATGCLSLALVRWAGMARAEAVMTATLLSFAWFALAAIWVFAADSAWRAWSGLIVSGVVLALGWATLGGA